MPYDWGDFLKGNKKRDEEEAPLGAQAQDFGQPVQMTQPPTGAVAQGFAQPVSYLPAGGGGSEGNASGRFVNFGKWFNLNRDKAQGVAKTVAGGVEQAAAQAREALKQQQAKFGQQVQQGTLKPWGGTVQPKKPPPVVASQRGGGLEGVPQRQNGGPLPVPTGQPPPPTTVAQSAAAPTDWRQVLGAVRGKNAQAASPPQGMSQEDYLTTLAKQGYRGPEDLGNATALDKAFGDVQDRATALKQPGGVEAALGREYGALGFAPTQSTGNSRLEAALAGIAGAPQLAATSGRYANFMGELEAGRASALGQAEAAKRANEAAQATYGAGLDALRGQSTAGPGPITMGNLGSGDTTLGEAENILPVTGATDYFSPAGRFEWNVGNGAKLAGYEFRDHEEVMAFQEWVRQQDPDFWETANAETTADWIAKWRNRNNSEEG